MTDGKPVVCSPERPCGWLSLVELAERIARDADRGALGEFHDHRTPFRMDGSSPLSLVSFLDALCDTSYAQRLVNHTQMLLELACDLTVDKFSNLPSSTEEGSELKSSGTDCRYYFRAFVQQMRKWAEANEGATPLEEEIVAAQCLQNHVVRQFRNSCLEAKRSVNPARTRYAWDVRGKSIYLWMPASMKGHERRRWLEANIDEADLSRPRKQCRIQSVVDQQLGVPRHVPLDDETVCDTSGHPSVDDLDSSIDEAIRVKGLADVVAEEKAENIDQQRPSIRALGPDMLRQLIRRIFTELSEGCYEGQALAQAFGLSKATLSRFAGSRWQTSHSAKVPDLWLNVARTLAVRSAFVEMAQAAGVWERVEQLVHEDTLSQAGAGR